MTATISVIVPVYNTQDYLRAALDSLLSQTMSFDEIIVIDDGSTDSSSEILKEYSFKGKIKLISQKNSGQGFARNAGIEVAKSDYIYFFDSDDLVSPLLVEKIKNEIAINVDLEIIVFGADVFYEEEFDKSSFSPKYERLNMGFYKCFFNAAVAMENSKTNYSQPCLYVLKKEVIDMHKIRFNAYLHEDDVFLLHLIAKVGATLVMKDKFFIRRVRPGSTMTSKKNINHVNGYLQASITAKNQFENSLSAERKFFFRKKAMHYYLNALFVSYKVEGFKKYDSVWQRIKGLPNYNLQIHEIISVIGGRRSPQVLEHFNRFRKMIKGK
ncbi:glycosyltransferase family A protein [Actimicrobium antarcticum]|uniref:Glycosyltransferase 2-like domain-containing protein n=1 Tax=Actimicrobium antarcticum TaxID=1051899 RepID=A0ABP7T4S6_9BURK